MFNQTFVYFWLNYTIYTLSNHYLSEVLHITEYFVFAKIMTVKQPFQHKCIILRGRDQSELRLTAGCGSVAAEPAESAGGPASSGMGP